MTTLEEVIAFSHEYCSNIKSQTKEKKQKIASAYRQLFGKPMNEGCGTCYVEAIFEIKKFMEKEPCKYRLKPGVLLQAFGDESKNATNINLTDELAEYHLRTNPGCAKYFAIIPVVEPEKELEIIPAETINSETIAEDIPVVEPEKIKRGRKPNK